MYVFVQRELWEVSFFRLRQVQKWLHGVQGGRCDFVSRLGNSFQRRNTVSFRQYDDNFCPIWWEAIVGPRKKRFVKLEARRNIDTAMLLFWINHKVWWSDSHELVFTKASKRRGIFFTLLFFFQSGNWCSLSQKLLRVWLIPLIEKFFYWSRSKNSWVQAAYCPWKLTSVVRWLNKVWNVRSLCWRVSKRWCLGFEN